MNCPNTGLVVEEEHSKCVTGKKDVELMILTSGRVKSSSWSHLMIAWPSSLDLSKDITSVSSVTKQNTWNMVCKNKFEAVNNNSSGYS